MNTFVAGEVAAVCAGQTSDLTAVHDVAAGGLGVALASMAVAAGVGVSMGEATEAAELFSEFPGRFVVATSDPQAFAARAAHAGVPVTALGTAGCEEVVIADLVRVSVALLADRRGGALERALQLVD